MWQNRINPQPMFDILTKARERELAGNYVARFEIGDTTGFSNLKLHKSVEKYSLSNFNYSPPAGEEKLIEVLYRTQWPEYSENKFKINVAPANFLILCSLAATTSPGDTIFIPNPYFPTYKLAAEFLGLNIVYYEVSLDGLPVLDNSKIELIQSNPALLIICNPSNPLGTAVDGKIFVDFIQEIRKRFPAIQVLLDETYVNLVYDSKINAVVSDEKAIRIRSLSKEHCAPGLRIGYVLSTSEIAETITNMISLTVSCSPSFIQLAVSEYLNSADAELFVLNLKKEMSQRILACSEIFSSEIMPNIPNSTFYTLVKIKDSETFEKLIRNNVSVCPGYKFGSTLKGYARISLAGQKENLLNDLTSLHAALEY